MVIFYQTFQFNLAMTLFQIQTPLRSNLLMMIKWIVFYLVVAPPTKFYTVSTVLFHKYGGANVSVKNCMSHFSMFVPTNATVKLANGITGHAQGIGIILCLFPNCSIIYPVGPVYYCPVI